MRMTHCHVAHQCSITHALRTMCFLDGVGMVGVGGVVGRVIGMGGVGVWLMLWCPGTLRDLTGLLTSDQAQRCSCCGTQQGVQPMQSGGVWQ